MKDYREKMIQEMKIRNFAEGTQAVYLRSVDEAVAHFGRAQGFYPESPSGEKTVEFHGGKLLERA